MTIRQIDNRVKKYKEGKLSKKEKSKLATAIMNNEEAKVIVFKQFINDGRLVSAFSVLGWEFSTRY